MKLNKDNSNLPIAYYDGECNFCFGLIHFLKKTGADLKVHLIPYQIVFDGRPGELLIISDSGQTKAGEAIIKLLTISGGLFYFPAILLRLLPPKALHHLYYWVANNRYRWFGKTKCSVH